MCFGKPLFELDLKEAKQLAGVRIYTVLSINRPFLGILFNAYENRVPCDITIEASNDRIIWDQVGNYSESRDLDPGLRWAARCKGNATFTLMSELALKNAEPCYLSVDFPVLEKRYRYLRVIVNDTFVARDGKDYNTQEHVTFHEFELYIGKEE